MFFYILLALFTLTGSLNEEEGFCSADNRNCESKIRQLDDIRLGKIKTAVDSYEDCNSNSCSCYFKTLNSDLKLFQNGITRKEIDSVRKKGTFYQIFEGNVYREKDCVFPARCAGIEHFLVELAVKLPNMDMVINTRDWPQINKHFGVPGPVFSFSKTSEYADIMFPAWSFWEGGPAISLYPRGLGRWDQHYKKMKEKSKEWPWEKKVNMGFFRGSRTSEERDPLVLLSRDKPELVDAQYTKNQAWKSSVDTLGAEPVKEISLEEHCMFRYLFNFRGVAASFRFKHLFLCGSVVIHVGNEWIEFFYPSLKPWVHYVPLKSNANKHDIENLLQFLRNHEDVAHDIAVRGQQFIVNHLRLKDVKCYWKHLLLKYSSLINYKVELDETLIKIK